MTDTTRQPLNRHQILEAALDLTDTHGLEALSMRRLAQLLGVEAMSLYNHVANKQEIVGGMLDLVMEEIVVPDVSQPWEETLRASAISAYQALRKHSWAASLVMGSAPPSPARLAWMNGVLGSLRQAGCSVELAHHAYHALDSHIIGFSLWLASLPTTGPELIDLASRLIDSEPFSSYPWLQEHMQYHIDEPHLHPEYQGSDFEFGLDLILDGVRRRRDATGS